MAVSNAWVLHLFAFVNPAGALLISVHHSEKLSHPLPCNLVEVLTVAGNFADIFRVAGVGLTPVLVVDLEDPVVAAAVISTLVVGSSVEATFPIRQT